MISKHTIALVLVLAALSQPVFATETGQDFGNSYMSAPKPVPAPDTSNQLSLAVSTLVLPALGMIVLVGGFAQLRGLPKSARSRKGKKNKRGFRQAASN